MRSPGICGGGMNRNLAIAPAACLLFLVVGCDDNASRAATSSVPVAATTAAAAATPQTTPAAAAAPSKPALDSIELAHEGKKGADGVPTTVYFLLDYKPAGSFLVRDTAPATATDGPKETAVGMAHPAPGPSARASAGAPPSALELEYQQQQRINTPDWSKWEDTHFETSLGDVRQWENQVAVSFSVLNTSGHAIEIVPPQIQIAGVTRQKKKKGKKIIADQLEIRDFRLSATRLEAGARADGVVLFDRPNYKQSTEKLYLQLAQADKIDQPVLIHLPFTPPVAGGDR